MPALDGIRILDMTQYEAGTSCTQALAWLGADVVKVEPPAYGDPGRGVGRSPEYEDYTPYYCAWNSNKRSLAVDLRTDGGHDLFMRLVPRFDVFVENYGPGVTERLGIDYETLSAANPQLIYTRIKGFGTTGPYAHFRCMDMIAQAAAGAFSITGEPDGPPMRPGSTTGDSGTGIQTAMAVLAAYIQRSRTGKGQLVEVSMQEAMMYYTRTRTFMASEWGTKAAPRRGNYGGRAPVNIYACKPFGPNDYIYLMPVNQEHWDALCVAIDRSDLLIDSRFATIASRTEHGDALYQEISNWTQAHTKYEAMETIGDAGVPCSACLDTADLHHDRHLMARGFIHEVDLPVHGKVPMLGFAPRLSESEFEIKAPPRLGEHTDDVLSSELGLDAQALSQLREAGVIGDPSRFS
ncbi:MAG: CoA transferase [Gammaproteobacteria bacterium]|nr:CoA transferase [Gammaproteobacteria bacterium]MDE0224985.1 CoA transferase [Gammaproteobacteria bacterium]